MNQFFTKQKDMMKSLKAPLDSQAAGAERNERSAIKTVKECV